MKPSEQRILAQLQAELSRVIRYDDESIVHDKWIRQRYDSGGFASFAPARVAAVQTAWHEAGHAVAALAVGERFNSASIHHSAASRGRGSQGRVHGVTGTTELAFVVDAAGQIAERLMNWTLLDSDEDLRAWLAAWKSDGGDARRFRRAIGQRFGRDEMTAWRYSEQLLTARRLKVRQVARALLVHPRHLTYGVVAAIADTS
jgi:hypothetical protein